MIKGIPEFEDLKEYLISERNGRSASGGTQCTIRCPYCGDSRDYRNQHMYVGPNRKANNLICFNCFLCNMGGQVNLKFFRDIDCYETDLINEILDYNNHCAKRNNYSRISDRYNNAPVNTVLSIGDVEEAFEKLAYINNRLGSNLDFADVSRLKIVLNLNRYLLDNHIGNTTRYPQIMNELSQKSIGFLSVDNSHVIMRAIVDPRTLSPTIARRYNNYTIFITPNNYLYYIIPGQVNPSKPITIYMTEGVMDILSVYLNIVQNKDNCIFAASCGKTQFCGLSKYIFTVMGVPPQLSNIQLYSDNDMNMNEFGRFRNQMNILGVPITIHRNTMDGEKDFGVPANKIIDSIVHF